jgi:hypothetical protein
MRTTRSKTAGLCASAVFVLACSRTPLLVTSNRAAPAVTNHGGSGGGAGTGTPAPANPGTFPDAGFSGGAGMPGLGFDAGSFVFPDAGVDAGMSMTEADAGTLRDASFPARGSVTITYTTVDHHGLYSPHNIGAAWIESASGAYVKTLEKWGFVRSAYLVAWLTASGGNTVDAVTSASLSTLVTHQATWNMTDVNLQYVPDGDYTLKIEFTDQTSAGPVATFPIRKGADALDEIEPDQGYIANILIHYQ